MEYCLTDLCELIMGQSPDSSSCNKDGKGIPFYQGNADFGDKNPTPRNWCLQPKKIAKKDDILISVRAPIGDLNIANEECCIGRGVAAIRMKSKECNRYYLYLFLESKSKYLQDCGTGSTFTAINKGVLETLKVNCPELKNQISIANEIENIKTAIKYKNSELLCLNEAVQSEFIEMFGEDLYNTSKKCKVSDVCTALIGLTYKPVNITESGTIVLRSGNIKNQELYLKDDIVRVSDITIKDEKYIKDKDILMCSRNGSARLVGKSCLIRNPEEKMSFGAFMTVIRTDYPYFMQSFFSSDFFKKQLVGVKTASVNQITTSMLYAYETIRIDKKKEKLFATFVQQINKSKFVVKQQIADLQELLDNKMQ